MPRFFNKKKDNIKNNIGFYTSIFLSMMIIWYCMTDEFNLLFLIFSIISSLSVMLILRWLDFMHTFHNVNPMIAIRIFKYYFWIITEIFKAGKDVARRVWMNDGSSNSGFCEIHLPKTNKTGIIVFANSITLTPGTISVHLDEDFVVVHVIDKSLENVLKSDTRKMVHKINEFVNYKE